MVLPREVAGSGSAVQTTGLSALGFTEHNPGWMDRAGYASYRDILSDDTVVYAENDGHSQRD